MNDDGCSFRYGSKGRPLLNANLMLSSLAVLAAANTAQATEPSTKWNIASASMTATSSAPENPTTYVMESSQRSGGTTRPASPVMLGIGVTLAGLGLISLGTGYFVYSEAPNCISCPGSEKRDLGTGLMAAGGIAFLIGLPLAIAGGRPVPDNSAWAKTMPTVFISPKSAALRWTF